MPEALTEVPKGLNYATFKWSKLVFPDAKDEANIGRVTIRDCVFNAVPSLASIVIGSSVGTIETNAFLNITSLKRVSFCDLKTADPSIVISTQAFAGCSNLESVVVGAAVKSIGVRAFFGCDNLSQVDFRSGIKKIDTQAFMGCTGLSKIVLPESLEEIGFEAFMDCTNIKSVRLPNNLKTIGGQAFAGCTGLTKIVIPASVEMINTGAFSGCTNLADVYVLGTDTKCENQAFGDKITYGNYTYQGTNKPNGDSVSINDAYKSVTGVLTRLHYPKEAYEKYVNEFIRVVGTDQYTGSKYDNKGDHQYWVCDAKGNKVTMMASGWFDNLENDYAGWWNFMLTDSINVKEMFEEEKRLVNGKWYSVCYPFDLSAEQIGNAFGSAAEVCEFSAATIVKDENGKKTLRLEFKNPVTEMKAHHPYMIHPGLHDAEYVLISGVVKDKDEACDNYKEKLEACSTIQTDEEGNVYTFIGNHCPKQKVPMYSYYYYSGNDTRWENGFYKAMVNYIQFNPQTAVVTLNKDNGIGGAKSFYPQDGFSDGGVTTEIVLPDTTIKYTNNGADANVYNVSGQIIRRNSTSLEGLSAGVYVVNGKKYVVK